MTLPCTDLGGLQVSRLVCGTNSFLGYSHISRARDQWIKRVMTPERIAEVLARGIECGVNTFLGPVNEIMIRAREIAEKATGVHMAYIATPSHGTDDEVMSRIDQCADIGVELCWFHTSVIEKRIKLHEQEITGLPAFIERVRKHGMVPGFTTHRPEAIPLADTIGLDVAGYATMLNAAGFMCTVEIEALARRILPRAQKPVLIIKPFASGRLTPMTGMEYVCRHMQEKDAVAVGVLSPEEIEEDVRLFLEFACGQAEVELPAPTRSKAVFEFHG